MESSRRINLLIIFIALLCRLAANSNTQYTIHNTDIKLREIKIKNDRKEIDWVFKT